VDTLDPIVVSASAFPTTLHEAPGTVSLITKKDIAFQYAIRMSEVLNQIPGVFVDEMGSRGGISSAYIRGGDPNFTTVMIDGIRINDLTNQRGGSVDFSTISPDMIERIEIIKGPISGLYGSDAMAGVINIITQPQQSTQALSLNAEGGSFGYAKGFISGSGVKDDLTYNGSVAFTRNDEQVEGDRYQLGTIGGNVNWSQHSSFLVKLSGRYSQTQTRGFPEGSGGPRLAILPETERRDTDALTLGLDLTHTILPSWQQKASAHFFYQEQDVNNPGVLASPGNFQIPPTIFNTQFTQFRFLWSHGLDLAAYWKLDGGLELRNEQGDRSGFQDLTVLGFPQGQKTNFDQSRFNHAWFLENSLSPLSWVRLVTGVRLDVPQQFSSKVTPRASLIVNLNPHTRFKANYGNGFKLPSFNALGDPIIGNPALSPETSRGWDLGFQYTSEQGTTDWELAYFHNKFSNLIDLDPTLARQNIFLLTNLESVTTQGIEGCLAINPYDALFLKGYILWLDHQIESPGDHLRNRPQWSGGWIIQLTPNPQLIIRSDVRAVGKRFDFQIPTNDDTVAGYIRTNLSLTFKVNNSWTMYGIVDNLTDTDYEEFLGFPAVGRTYRFGLTYSI
jgi:outer membrane cobalamin receptor